MDEVAKARRPKAGGIPFGMGMVLVTLGVVYGDIGTSPMYTLKAIMGGNGGLSTMTEDVVLGALSLIIWTITLITTVKYVLVAMQADNHNEGGIFALYSLVRRCKRWLILPAMIGGAALLADGILTPAVTVTTAIEGLRTIDEVYRVIGDNQAIVITITVAIISVLFLIQRAGTSKIGRFFGPVMTLWFFFLGAFGIINVVAAGNLRVLLALNPLRGITFLFSDINAAGLMVLGNVFLCTTGAEALYSDMGHVGKANVYASWPFVKLCLILNYLGQGAWILANNANPELLSVPELNPFFQMIPENLRVFAVILSTLAAIIASQALITGSYSIVSEAIRLNLLPHMRIAYPSETKGQIYIPLVNYIMWVSCILVVLFFQTSTHMEAAYGLAITITMLMTTVLLTTFLAEIRHKKVAAGMLLVFFGLLEGMFFLSSLTKFMHGGYSTVLLATTIFIVMYTWRRGTAIEHTQTVYLHISDYVDQLRRLRDDDTIPELASNLVFLTNDSSVDRLDRDILYSILDKKPKRAKAYWFINVHVTDEPYTNTYTVNTFGTDFIFKVQLQLGFRVNQRINTYLRQIVNDLIESGELAPQPRSYSIYKNPGSVGDFRFCMIRKQITPDTDIPDSDLGILRLKYAIRRFCGSPAQWYGLESSSVLIEFVPLFGTYRQALKLDRVNPISQDTEIKRESMARDAEMDDTDIFSADVLSTRDSAAKRVRDELVGGDTAVFEALFGSDDDDGDTID